MALTPEGKVKKDIKEWLTARGVWFAGRPAPGVVTGWMYMPVPGGMGVNGIPDFCGIYKGRPLYIEAKAPKNSAVSETQKDRHKEIRAAGGLVFVVKSVEELELAFHIHDLSSAG